MVKNKMPRSRQRQRRRPQQQQQQQPPPAATLPAGFDPVHFRRVSMSIATLEHDPETAPRMKYLHPAFDAFSEAADGRSNMDQERVYLEFYHDVRDHEDVWFRRIYARRDDGGVPMSHVFAEWSVDILGTLATIRRQRGDLTTCLQVLQLDERVLQRYEALLQNNGELLRDARAQRCLAGLTFKYHTIATLAHQQARHKRACLQSFRAAARHEIEQQYDRERQKFAWMIENSRANVVGRENSNNYMSVEFLDQTPDDFIWSVLMSALLTWDSEPPETVEPWICDGYGGEEEFCGDYKRCQGCRKAYYCSRDCQLQHWKLHKSNCKNKGPKTSASMMQSIKKLCQSTIRKYCDAVNSGTDREISEEQKKAAFPGLAQLVSKYILEHPRGLSQDDAFVSSASDLQFRKEIDAFLAAQSGFEVMNQPAMQEITDEQRCAMIAKELMNLYKERLLEVARQTVATMCAEGMFAAMNIAPDAPALERASQKVVSTVMAYAALQPEYCEQPESFGAALREGRFDDMISTVLADYFNGLAADGEA